MGERKQSVVPVILAGGAGSRLQPLSSPERPKQFMPLIGDRCLFQETLGRFSGAPFAAPLVLTSAAHVDLARAGLAAEEIVPAALIAEPLRRDTAPAVAIAALVAARDDPGCVLAISPSDQLVTDDAAFRAAVAAGVAPAREGAIVLFAVPPKKPDPRFGYMVAGRPGADGVRPVHRFVEKPEQDAAAALIAEGDAFWNAGLFVARADVLIAALENKASHIMGPCRRALDVADDADGVISLGRDAFAAAPAISLDHALIEKRDGLVCVSLEAGWCDIGSREGFDEARAAGLIAWDDDD